MDPEALVWRHWFTTLRQMMAQLPPEEHPEVAVAPLPGRVTTAGEWYLAVPAGSAAQEVSLEVIKLLTSRVAELERFRRGVGLPTRSSIFPPHEATTPAEEGGPQPYKPLDLGLYAALATVTTRPAGPSDRSPDASNPFRRSQFNSYSQFAPILADHLKQIIELGGRADGDAGGETGIRVAIREILDRIQEHLRFVGANDCPGCQKRAHRGPQARDAGTAEVPRSKSR